MATQDQDNLSSPWDAATAARLARLGAAPVDTSRLDAFLREQIPRRRPVVIRRLLRPLAAVAASLVVLVSVAAVILTNSGGEVMASPAQMAQVHRDIVANRTPVIRVASIEEAARALSAAQAEAPDLPQPPQSHVMACCMKSIRDKRVACVLLQDQTGVPVTMSVARSSDMRLPKGPSVTREGATYFVQSSDSLHMVTTERSGRWVCLIAELPQDRLIDLAAQLQF